MLIVGERINTSRKVKGESVIEAAVVNRDASFIKDMAVKQFEAGAMYIDANCGTLTSGEPEALEWITKVVMDAVDAPIWFDTPNPWAREAALEAYVPAKGQPMNHSITVESERYANVLPWVLRYKAKVIALAMDDTGIQQDPEKRLAVARTLVSNLKSAGRHSKTSTSIRSLSPSARATTWRFPLWISFGRSRRSSRGKHHRGAEQYLPWNACEENSEPGDDRAGAWRRPGRRNRRSQRWLSDGLDLRFRSYSGQGRLLHERHCKVARRGF